jgi:hypothetical protein
VDELVPSPKVQDQAMTLPSPSLDVSVKFAVRSVVEKVKLAVGGLLSGGGSGAVTVTSLVIWAWAPSLSVTSSLTG